jgi:hypothetical protein
MGVILLAAMGLRAIMAAGKRVLPGEQLLSSESRPHRGIRFQMPCIWNQELVWRVKEMTPRESKDRTGFWRNAYTAKKDADLNRHQQSFSWV